MPAIVVSQFAGTSLWFAGNAVLHELQTEWNLPGSALAWLTSAVQLGFIVGTLVFASLNIADRYSPRRVFAVSALLAAAANAAIVIAPPELSALLVARFVTGFFLAGVYPVGMKIAASWFERGLGKALGLLVGALVVGTAFPHLLKAGGGQLPWRAVLLGVSGLACAGGVLLYLVVPDGPHLRSRSAFDPRAFVRIFREPKFRAAALGYFGHMWELYSLWAFVPLLLASTVAADAGLDVSLWSFLVIGAGAVGCVVGGLLSTRWGSARVAAIHIAVSGLLCLFAPLLTGLPTFVVLAVLVIWGVAAAGDSPQFSALNAQAAPRELVGTALTLVTSLGFLVSIPSIQLMSWLTTVVDPGTAFLALAPGPILGFLSVRRLIRHERLGS